MNIAFIPIDNRPVCYTLPEQICAIDESISFFIPEREFLGSLKKNADVEKIFEWLKNLPEINAIVMCLDTLAYGGLIPSRRSKDTFKQIKNRIEKLKEILIKKNAKIYAFSSIMRISNNNINEEEKEYWKDWGKKIFEYSYQTHKNGISPETDIPEEILEDYLATRKRNFEINKLYLEWQKEGLFETLVFSKDDCAEYGFNVQEAQKIEQLGGFVKTGADEIPLTLLARAVNQRAGRLKQLRSEAAKRNSHSEGGICLMPEESHKDPSAPNVYLPQDDTVSTEMNRSQLTVYSSQQSNQLDCHVTDIPRNDDTNLTTQLLSYSATSIKIAPVFLEPEYKHLISNYEDVSIEQSVRGQIELAGCEVCEPDEADILLYVNNFKEHQGEIVMKVPTEPFSGVWKRPEKPYMIADVRYANGADNEFVKKLFEAGLDDNFLGYSAWNTSANTFGSLICTAIAYWRARRNSGFTKLQVVRFLDDWAYQANVRQQLEKPDENLVKEKMRPYEDIIFEILGERYEVSYKFTWNRLFEVEVCILRN